MTPTIKRPTAMPIARVVSRPWTTVPPSVGGASAVTLTAARVPIVT